MIKVSRFVRVLLGAVRYGSWGFSKELDDERVLFPEAYELRKKLNKRKGN
ncbi:MAG: hypothetical protein QMD80_04250 [archaeon]|nr:hypothetical protein [archaeon]